MRAKWWVRGAGALSAAVLGAVAYAPYLPRLLNEGFPQAAWPAPGSYATVKGGAGVAAERPSAAPQLNAALAAEFTEKDGRAILAARDGKLIVEHYAPGITRETRLNSYSMIKSLIGALVLKAIAEGRIESLDVAIGRLLPDIPASTRWPGKYPITALPLCRVLNMRSGVVFQPKPGKSTADFGQKDFETANVNVFGPLARLHTGGLAAVTPRLLANTEITGREACHAGSYSYQNVNTALLGAVLERAYAQPLETILSEKLWAPANARDAEWRRYDAGLSVTPYCCLYARPIDWLHVAQYIASNGTPDAPFLPNDLWRQFVGYDVPVTDLKRGHYAHHVYHNVLDRPGEDLTGTFAYFMGTGGQTTYLMPDQKLVAVRFGGQIQRLHSLLYGVARHPPP